MKELLITSGYPRSGSTYLNQALNLLYYPERQVNLNEHTVITITNGNNIIVPFRKPLDAIASWKIYPLESTLDQDIKFYIRFHKAVLDNLYKVILMDFDYFTKDIDYIKNKVFKNFGIGTDNYVTDAQVKKAMLANGKEINLPRNNKEELDAVKAELQGMAGFNECVELYNALKSSSIQD